MTLTIFLLSFAASLCADLVVVLGIAFFQDYYQHLERTLDDQSKDF